MSDEPDRVRVKFGDGGSSISRERASRRPGGDSSKTPMPPSSPKPGTEGRFNPRRLSRPRPRARAGTVCIRRASCARRTAVRLSFSSAFMLLVREGSSSFRPATISLSHVPILLSMRSNCFCDART